MILNNKMAFNLLFKDVENVMRKISKFLLLIGLSLFCFNGLTSTYAPGALKKMQANCPVPLVSQGGMFMVCPTNSQQFVPGILRGLSAPINPFYSQIFNAPRNYASPFARNFYGPMYNGHGGGTIGGCFSGASVY